MNLKVLFSVFLFGVSTVDYVIGSWEQNPPNTAFDNSFYEAALDPELCDEQIRLIKRNPLLTLMFADAGIRVPRGILQGNNVDLGNYHQCIGINQELPDNVLQGKYCMIQVPMDQTFELPEWPWLPSQSNFDLNMLNLDNETIRQYEEINKMKVAVQAMTGQVGGDSLLSGMTFRLAVCIPKPCSTQQAITSLLFNISKIGFQYTDEFCRLPDDKPWVAGDYVVIVVFAAFGFVTLLSTSYDIWHTFFRKTDPKTASVIGKSFSVYTNGRRLMTFTSGPNNLECLDGIRALSMAWILLGHTYTIQPFWVNPIDGMLWQRTYASLWVSGAHSAVDTFFALSGLLLVYTTTGKLSGMSLLKNIHLFYLNRLLRMFPLLAVAVLVEATWLHRMTDGPVWNEVAGLVESCRANWWSTLLHIQNYATQGGMVSLSSALYAAYDKCIIQTWYLAIDTQLHILSPIVLVFVLSGNRKVAWSALLAAVLGIMVFSTTYNFLKKFPSTMGAPGRPEDIMLYVQDYYLNTLTRSSPFVVAMPFGYLIYLSKQSKVKMNKLQVAVLWTVTLSLSTFVMYTNYPIVQWDWSNQTLDSLYNSFSRPVWAVAVCLVVFACVTGYGGPINWFLSLQIWKLPARISYAMYLFHYMLIVSVKYAAVTPYRFSVAGITFDFLAHYSLSFVVSFFMTLIIDSPFSTLFKRLLGSGPKLQAPKPVLESKLAKENEKQV